MNTEARWGKSMSRLEIHLQDRVVVYNTHSYRVDGDVTVVYPHCNPRWATSRFKSVDILKIVNDEEV